jgi:hypothetical protein
MRGQPLSQTISSGDAMESDAQQLVGNMLDALDRLFDRKARPIEVYELAFATSFAVSSEATARLLREAADALVPLLERSLPADDENREALRVTQELRDHLAEIY